MNAKWKAKRHYRLTEACYRCEHIGEGELYDIKRRCKLVRLKAESYVLPLGVCDRFKLRKGQEMLI